MSELIKREDAISRKELLDYINDHREDFSDYNGYSQMFDFVDTMPTVDAVPVTRCGQCKHGSKCPLGVVQCKMNGYKHRADWFCADGERK